MATIYETFQDLTADEFILYADDILSKQRTSDKRKQLLTYLQTVNSFDNTSIETERTILRTKIKQNRLKDKKIVELLSQHSFDFSKNTELFTQDTLSSAQLTTLLTLNDSEVFLDENFSQDLVITGDSILIYGEGSNSLSARNETLQNAVTINGDIIVTGKDVKIKGITFNGSSDQTIKFIDGAENISFENCIFNGPVGDSDSKWVYGENLKGNVTLTNCIVTGYTSWYLFDVSSTSGEPQYAQGKVRIKRCLFKNNAGSGAIRGKTGQPTKLVQVNNNKFIN